MAFTLDPATVAPIDLEEFGAKMSRAEFTRAEDLCDAAEVFAALNANRSLLVDYLNRSLRAWRDGRLAGEYTGQVFVLLDAERYYVRANVWLPPAYATLPTAGEANQFFYGLPHDHNFSFMTAGHYGPGYRTQIFEYDGVSRTPKIGEPVDVRFLEDTSLEEGKIMVYRASTDIHIQHPPAAFTISLNLMSKNSVEFARTQCLFDERIERVAKHSRGAESVRENFLTLAALIGDLRTESLLGDLSENATAKTKDLALKALDLLRLDKRDSAIGA
jgi:hypothetical protein